MNTLTDKDNWRWYSQSDTVIPTSYISVTTVIDNGSPTPQKLKNWFKNNSANKIKKTLKETGQKGTDIHNMIESDLAESKEMPVPEELEPFAQAFKKWKLKVNAKPLHLEKVLYSDKYGFAGRCDFIGEIEGKVVVADWKTSNVYKKEPWMEQLGAYRLAAIEMGLVPEDCGMVCLMIPRDNPDKIRHFTYQHYEFCENSFLTSLTKLKQHYYYKLDAMEWNWLHQKAMERV